MRWTHFTLPVSDVDGSVQFFVDICGLSLIKDRRKEGGSTLWLGPQPGAGEDPDFVLVIAKGEVQVPLDHFGFQCDSYDEFLAIAARAETNGTLVEKPQEKNGDRPRFLQRRP